MMKRVLSVVLAAALFFGLFSVVPVTASAASGMTVSDACVEMIKSTEGFSAVPYWDYSQWSIGYGSRCPDEDLERYRAEGISLEEADALMREYLSQFENYVDMFLAKYDLTVNQGQYDALISLTYSVGVSFLFADSGTLLSALVNGATGNEFIYAISIWCSAGGEFLYSLMRRRLIEANMYLNGIYGNDKPTNYCYVIYDANGGVRDAMAQGYDCNLVAVPMSVPTYEGYTFVGWYTDPVGGTKITTLDETTNGMKLYAHWEKGVTEAEKPTNPVEGVKVTVTGSSVNVRSGPGITYSIVNGVFKGDELVITGTTNVEGTLWGKFSKGWICLTYTNYSEIVGVEPDPGDDEEPTETLELPIKATVLSSITLYNGPHTTFPKKGTLSQGDEIVITEMITFYDVLWAKCEGGWIQANLKILLHDDKKLAHNFNVVSNYSYLNVRSGPGMDNKAVSKLSKGDEVEVLAVSIVDGEAWGRIEKGWISLQYTTYDPARLSQYQSHSYSDWSAISTGTCVTPGQEQRVCSYCGHCETRNGALEDHSYGDWYISKEATCVATGEQRHDCVNCDHYELQEIPATGEHILGDWYVSKAATCTEVGEERRDCLHCEYYEVRQIEAAGHSYGAWYVTVEPTMEAVGQEQRDCAACGHSETREVAALEHEYGEWYVVKEPTCTEAGEERRDCLHCEQFETRQIAMLPHSYGDWHTVKEATCTQAGERQRECVNCGHSETQATPLADHSYGDWYLVKEATCTELGEQRRDCACGHWESEVIALAEHSLSDWYVVKEATCVELGTQCRECKNCDYAESRDVALTGHSYSDWQTVTPSTCTQVGQQRRECTVCGHYESAALELAEHSFGQWYEILAATVEEGGLERRDCENCDHYETRETDPLPPPVIKTYATITTSRHNVRSGPGYGYGTMGMVFWGFKVEILEQVTAADGSEWGRIGENLWICLLSTSMKVQQVEIDASDIVQSNTTVWATVTASALNVRTGVGTSNTQIAYLNRGTVIQVLEQKKDASGNTWGRVTENGWMLLTGNATLETVSEGTGGEHTEHTYGAWYVVTDATCTGDGLMRHDCTQCDHYEEKVVTAAGHSYGDWYVVTDATCTLDGIMRRECAACGHYEEKAVAAAGHSYGAWYVSKEATATEYGQERRDCEHCDHYEIRQTDKLETETVTKVYATVTANSLSIRPGAGDISGRLGSFYTGARVEILEQKTVNGVVWGRTTSGWIWMTGYTTVETVTEDATQSLAKTMTVKADSLNIRSGAGTGYSRTGCVYNGVEVTVEEIVTVNGTQWARIAGGWVSMDYLV